MSTVSAIKDCALSCTIFYFIKFSFKTVQKGLNLNFSQASDSHKFLECLRFGMRIKKDKYFYWHDVCYDGNSNGMKAVAKLQKNLWLKHTYILTKEEKQFENSCNLQERAGLKINKTFATR